MANDWSLEGQAEDAEQGAAITDLLNAGYDLLDGFVNWLEQRLGLDIRTAQQDCFNAESLIDYLANYHYTAVADINEFELRWFVFSHYIRKAMADLETEERLLDSLNRFFGYLHAEHAFVVQDWVETTLDDKAFYTKRCLEYRALNSKDEQEWEKGYRDWSMELEQDLDSRCLWMPRDLQNGFSFQDRMGWREATLCSEANQLWQEERSELLRQGLDYETIHERLRISLLEWLDTPQDRLEGQTPGEVIQKEREEHPIEAEEESIEEDR